MNDTEIDLGQGPLTEEPMLFLEYNFQAVLSMRDTLYMGQYALENDSILLYFYPSDLGLTRVQGVINDNSSINGTTGEGNTFRMDYERIDGEENYLNEVYR